MEYLIPVVLLLLLVTGFVTFVVLNATRRSNASAAADSEHGDPSGMAATDPSPLGDTTEHAGTQSAEGHTVDDPEGEGGTGSASSSGESGQRGREGDEPGPEPESERLANRPV